MIRPPQIRAFADDEATADNFAGGGGVSTGIEEATGESPDVAINHNAEALATHEANHPETLHLRENVYKVDPLKVLRRLGKRRYGLAWFSPDCTDFSKAKGARPFRDPRASRRRRALAWVVVKWARLPASARPRIIIVENVEEFRDWGPLKNGEPDPDRRGECFRRWCSTLRNLGYALEWRELVACDYGAPTRRKRLFIVGRCDGQPIQWPAQTHGPRRAKPFRTAAECIDWSDLGKSIFERKRPLVDATCRRIAYGFHKFVLDSAQPFILPLTHRGPDSRVYDIHAPIPTITCAHRGEFALVAPTLIQTGYGERHGRHGEQVPRALDIRQPLGTIVAGGSKHALVAAFLAKHYGGPNGHQTPGSPMTLPFDTVTTQDHHALIAASLVKLYGTCEHGADVREPMPTVTATGNHIASVAAFMVAYYGTAKDGGSLFDPLRTVTTKDRLALVSVLIGGVRYVVADIWMRMLKPPELFRAQGFPRDYIIDPVVNGRPLTLTAQTRMAGNSVSPQQAAAVVRANLVEAAA